MAKKPLLSRIRNAVFLIMSFILSLVLFLLTFSIVLTATVFNIDFIFSSMNSSNYFVDKKDEITVSLTDLGYASGLDEEFFEDFVDEVMISNDTKEYLDNYYAGKGTVIDVTQFKQSFNQALGGYIEENNIKNVNGESREMLINKAAQIYRMSLAVPLFSKFSSYILSAKDAMPFAVSVLVLICIVICFVLVKANKWKHRAVKYISCAALGAAVSTAVIPLYLLISGKLTHINLASRALYNFFIRASSDACVAILFCSLFLLLAGLGLYFLFRRMHQKVSS